MDPLIYGETSISNIVKRYPIKFIFKPLMFLSAVLMITYWFLYNKVLNDIFQTKRISIFLVFGVLSAIFLFLHVYFLGQKYENEIFNHAVTTDEYKLIIQEAYCSVLLQLIIILMKHEGFDFTVDPWSKTTPVTDDKNVWAGNIAVSNMIFDDKKNFE